MKVRRCFLGFALLVLLPGSAVAQVVVVPHDSGDATVTPISASVPEQASEQSDAAPAMATTSYLTTSAQATSDYSITSQSLSVTNTYAVSYGGDASAVTAAAGNGPALDLGTTWFTITLDTAMVLDLSATLITSGLQSGLDTTRQWGVYSFQLTDSSSPLAPSLLSYDSTTDPTTAPSATITLDPGTYYLGSRALFRYDQASEGDPGAFDSSGRLSLTASFIPVPEPSVWQLVGLGMAVVGMCWRRDISKRLVPLAPT